MLIITGPQGSGNHIFSRILSLHQDVAGWEEILDNYWIPSDQAPFANYFVNPELLTAEEFEGKDFHLVGTSCPFFFNGIRVVPKIVEFAKKASSFGIDVQIAIIVRDQNINQVQQERVRGIHTTPIAQEYYYNELIPSGFPVHFLDHEAFFLHKGYYLKWVSDITGFPIAYNSPDLMKFISTDANSKYITTVKEYWLDPIVHAGCTATLVSRIN